MQAVGGKGSVLKAAVRSRMASKVGIRKEKRGNMKGGSMKKLGQELEGRTRAPRLLTPTEDRDAYLSPPLFLALCPRKYWTPNPVWDWGKPRPRSNLGPNERVRGLLLLPCWTKEPGTPASGKEGRGRQGKHVEGAGSSW